jgi:DivIVA domain-containing protein
MVDESFHLTAVDVRRYDFGSALRGYDKARVDQFRDQVADELERLTRLHQDLDAKAKGFHEQLRAFRERDKALNEALVSAQQLRAEIREQAEREAQLILREARAEGERLLGEARAEVRRIQASIDALERTRRAHVAQARALVQRQLTEIDAAESALPEPVSGSDAGAAKDDGKTADPPEPPKVSTPSWLDSSVPE